MTLSGTTHTHTHTHVEVVLGFVQVFCCARRLETINNDANEKQPSSGHSQAKTRTKQQQQKQHNENLESSGISVLSITIGKM